MPPESWLVLAVAAAFLLLGIAGSPLAWALLLHRRSRFEELMEQRWRKLADELRALDDRLTRFETINAARTEPSHLEGADAAGRPGGVHAADSFSRADGGLGDSRGRTVVGGRGSARADSAHEPPLIAVPTLEGAGTDRDVTASWTQGTPCRDLDNGGNGSHGRGDRAGHRASRRPDRADPGPETPD